MKRYTLVLILSLLFCFILVFCPKFCIIKASGTIYITADGSINPSTVNITTVDRINYTFTADISDSIIVQRNNIIIDGANYRLQGTGSGSGFSLTSISNVTIKDVNIENFYYGIYFDHSSLNTISRSNLTGNTYGIWLFCSSKNTLRNNIMVGNRWGFGIWGWSLSGYLNDVDGSNMIEGKPIYYLLNQENLIINPTTFPDVGYLALVNSTRIKIENLTLTNGYHGMLLAYTRNSIISNNKVADNEFGIFLFSSSNNTVSKNNAIHNYVGIEFHTSSNNNTITENNITNNTKGLGTEFSSNNIILRNNITANKVYGILLYSTSYCTISENNVIGNTIGIGFSPSSSSNTVSRNTISKNSECGIQLSQCSNNSVYYNNFINDTHQVITLGSDNTNFWDNGYPSGGNYWSDYNGTDIKSGPYQNETGSDGIGDTPHIIDGNNKDCYPLMTPYPPLRSDLNRDGRVDGKDIAVVAQAFASYPSHKRWSFQADLNSDKKIDGMDLIIVAKNWGKKA
jgi:parallel beta-helix repeat protein